MVERKRTYQQDVVAFPRLLRDSGLVKRGALSRLTLVWDERRWDESRSSFAVFAVGLRELCGKNTPDGKRTEANGLAPDIIVGHMKGCVPIHRRGIDGRGIDVRGKSAKRRGQATRAEHTTPYICTRT